MCCLPTHQSEQQAGSPLRRWNLFIKSNGYLDSFLNVGATLDVGSAHVISCSQNGYVLGLSAVTTCSGIEALQVCPNWQVHMGTSCLSLIGQLQAQIAAGPLPYRVRWQPAPNSMLCRIGSISSAR